METEGFVRLMETLAPPHLAESWDNVGVLIAPLRPVPIQRILLTIDLTERVVAEAVAWGAEAVVAYHPPIFGGLKRLVPTERSARVALLAISAGLLVYSPHTALDAARGGVNDWLCGAFDAASVRAVIDKTEGRSSRADASEQARAGSAVVVGQGRELVLRSPLSLEELVADVKSFLNLTQVRLATADRHATVPVRSIAFCPGAGGSVLSTTTADVLLTGEMRHHDVLHHVESGRSVVLTEHTNTERGYLPVLAARLSEAGLSCRVATADRDPLAGA